MRRFLIVLSTLALAFPAWGQIPGEPIAIGKTPVVGGVNGDCLTVSSGKVGQTAACGGAAGLTVGTSTVTSGTDTRVLFDNAGVLGEYAISGTGSVAMTMSPTLTTPTLGVAAGTSLALGGATIGTDALGVTGNMTLTGIGVVSANSASDALAVTQAGAGNSFAVYDSVGSTQPFLINGSGQIIIGTTAALTLNGVSTTKFQYIGTATNKSTLATATFVSNTTGGAMGFSKSRSDTIGTQTVVASGDTLGTFYAEGSDGTAFISAAKIAFQVDGTPGTNDMPGRIVFSVTADGAAAVTEAMRISNTLAITAAAGLTVGSSTAITAGGSTVSALKFSSTASFGIFVGSGAPSISAAKGSLYLRSDGTGIADRAYINTNGSTTWTNLVTGG